MTKSTSPAHKAYRERRKQKRLEEPDTSITMAEAAERSRRLTSAGAANGNAKLDWAAVQEIRSEKGRTRAVELARHFGVHAEQVRKIWRGVHWSNADAVRVPVDRKANRGV